MSENRQKLLKSTEKQKTVQERPKKVKIIALKLSFINKNIQKSIKGILSWNSISNLEKYVCQNAIASHNKLFQDRF